MQLRTCSYQRSGTHLLMATLYYNFDFEEDLSLNLKRGDLVWRQTPEAVDVVVLWGRLHFSHKPFDTLENRPENIVYPLRHPVSIMRSVWNFTHATPPFKQFMTTERAKNWMQHIEGFRPHVHFVRYEHLLKEQTLVPVLEKLKNKFNLKPTEKYPHLVKERVGWVIKRRPAEPFDEEHTRRILRSVLPKGYLGYTI